MTQEDIDLLIKDLSSRLPYGVKWAIQGEKKAYTLSRIEADYKNGHLFDFVEQKNGFNMQVYTSEVKPYLFPLSSMTDEQKYTCPIGVANLETFIKNESWTYLELTPDSILCLIDWLNRNHFDYRGLIPMGLAEDATGLNIY